MKSRLLFFLLYAICWLALFIFLRLIFIVANYIDSGLYVSSIEFFKIFLYGLKLDISATAYILVLPGLLLGVAPFFSRAVKRLIAGYTAIVAFLIVLLSVVDLRFYKYLGYRLDLSPLLYLKKPSAAVTASITFWDVLIPLFLASVILVMLVLLYQRISGTLCELQGNRLTSPVIFTLIAALLIIPMRGGFGLAPINIGAVYFSPNLYADHCSVNLPWNIVYSLTKAGDYERFYRFMENDRRQQLMDSLYLPAGSSRKVLNSAHPNVVLFILESFTAKLIGLKRDGREITPNFNRLISEGIYFSRFYASGDRTDKGLPAILSGYPAQPLTSIINHHRKMESLPNVLNEVKRQGYATFFYYGGDIDFSNFRAYVVHGGASQFMSRSDFPASSWTEKWGASDGVVFDTVARQAQKMRQPFFAVILSLSSHEPYDVPGKPLLKPTDLETKFLNAAHYTDRCLGEFISEMKSSGLWDNLLIVITADHGHQLPGYTPINQPERFRIPMLWTGGALTVKETVTATGSQTDIAETLLHQLSIPRDFPFGKDLFSSGMKPFAWYSFNDGFGFITDSSTLVFDGKMNRYVMEEGKPSPLLIEAGKAYLQTVVDDFSSR
ncbi:MAG TPA: sulfatase-like hydrolase/transferase [Chitinophagales bacterium]|nr:sulfatase-like hydrolase/transferase [Chitinophagales bacterium]